MGTDDNVNADANAARTSVPPSAPPMEPQQGQYAPPPPVYGQPVVGVPVAPAPHPADLSQYDQERVNRLRWEGAGNGALTSLCVIS